MQITLATLPQATPRQVFEHVKAHLLKQNKLSIMGQRGTCAYRSEDGTLSCAAGCLMSDDEHRDLVRANSDRNIMDWEELISQKLVPAVHRELISELQFIHDSVDSDLWEERLAAFKHRVDEGLYGDPDEVPR